MDFLVDTFLGFVIAQYLHTLRRKEDSLSSPKEFSRVFFLKDNWLKIVASLIASVSISILINRHAVDIESIFIGPLWTVYFAAGAAPEFVLQILKDKFGLFQPKTVTIKTKKEGKIKKETFIRK